MNYKSSMTDIGTAMIASADKAEKAIIFDSFLITEADLSGETDLMKSTASLFSSSLTYPVNSKSTLDNTFTVKAVLANKTEKFTVDQDFHINAIGIMAHIEGDANSKLMTIAVADGSGAVITAFKGTLYSLTVAITQVYQADRPVNFKLANVAYALAEDLDKLKTDVQVIIDSDLADVAKTNVDNKFSTMQTLAGGATDGQGNAYATQAWATDQMTTIIKNSVMKDWQKATLLNGNSNQIYYSYDSEGLYLIGWLSSITTDRVIANIPRSLMGHYMAVGAKEIGYYISAPVTGNDDNSGALSICVVKGTNSNSPNSGDVIVNRISGTGSVYINVAFYNNF